MKKNERAEALTLLLKLFKDKTPLSHLMQANKNLSPMTKEICFGICRHYYRLEALADCLLKKRPKEPEIWLIILIGLYQLHFMKKSDYAVVYETVALLDLLKKSWAKGLVNAVLRTYCREQTKLVSTLQQKENFLYGHPDWFIKRIKNDWPKDWQAILEANDCHPPMSLRVNRRRSSRSDYRLRLEQAGLKLKEHRFSIDGLTLEQPCNVQDLPGFAEGDCSVQDESAQLAVSLLDLKPNLRLLDVCCAPGGKTCHILEAEPGLSACLALDIDEKRLERVRENLSRLGLEANLLQGDGLNPKSWWDGQPFDRILLDAPCSATGVIRRHPDIKLLRTEAEISKISDLQFALLQSLWPLLAPKGILVYATCSVMSQENDEQIARFIAQQSDCQFLAEDKPWGRKLGHGWQILPGDFDNDGFFYSILQKM